jgi:hypothetical protein
MGEAVACRRKSVTLAAAAAAADLPPHLLPLQWSKRQMLKQQERT